MSFSQYFIFLGCFFIINALSLYSYYLAIELKSYNELHNETFYPVLKKAAGIQLLFFLAGCGILVCFNFSAFSAIRYAAFGGTALLAGVGVLALLPSRKWVQFLRCLLELGGFTGLIFLLPESDFYQNFQIDPVFVKAIVATGWFILFKTAVAFNKMKGLVYEQCFSTGFICLILFIFFLRQDAMLQAGSLLSVLIFLIAPFIYVLRYDVPLSRPVNAMFGLISTGFCAYLFLYVSWADGVLTASYFIFEAAVCVFHIVKNLFPKQNTPLFLFEYLLEKGVPPIIVLNFTLRRNILLSALILFNQYIPMQPQIALLTALIYLKFYIGIVSPKSRKSSLIDLYKEAKASAKSSLIETDKAISVIKDRFKKTEQNDKEKK